jgi:hypothetical protein
LKEKTIASQLFSKAKRAQEKMVSSSKQKQNLDTIAEEAEVAETIVPQESAPVAVVLRAKGANSKKPGQ